MHEVEILESTSFGFGRGDQKVEEEERINRELRRHDDRVWCLALFILLCRK